MKNQFLNTTLTLLLIAGTAVAQKAVSVDSFEKVIVSPHVKVTFIQGNEESVAIEECTIDQDKVNVEVNGKTLRIYLDGAKEVTKNKDVVINGSKVRESIYNGTVLTVSVFYKNLSDVSIRGEETILFNSPISQENLQLKIYGESSVYFEALTLNRLNTNIHGESYLEIKSGIIGEQRITAYGGSRINTLGIENNKTKFTAYGDSDVNFNVSDLLKVTAYGDATVGYTGGAQIKKGLTIGDVKIYEISL